MGHAGHGLDTSDSPLSSYQRNAGQAGAGVIRRSAKNDDALRLSYQLLILSIPLFAFILREFPEKTGNEADHAETNSQDDYDPL